MNTDYAYAIDYGTSNSLLSVVTPDESGTPLELDDQAMDPTVFRSILYFPDETLCHYGQKAIEEYNLLSGEGRLIRSIKKFLPSTSFLGSYIGNRVVKIEDLVGYFLLEMKKRADNQVGYDVKNLILGRPAKYSLKPDEDKLAQYRMEKAAQFAGFDEIHFLAEPIAAAFDLKKTLTQEKTVLVADLGGGTSDFTVIKIGPKTYQEEDLLALGGVSIAGDAMDGAIMSEHIASHFGSNITYRVPMGSNTLNMPPLLKTSLASPADIVQLQHKDAFHFFKDMKNWQISVADRHRLDQLEILVEDQLGFSVYEEIGRCKRELSNKPSENFVFNYPGIDIYQTIGQPEFIQAIYSNTQKILSCLNETLLQSGLQPQDIDTVYCTGGTSKLGYIQSELEKIFGPERLFKSNHFHSVIKGLSHRAQELFFY